MHTPYEQIRHHPADFRVKYRFFTKDEGGRHGIIPYQGYRSDFWYENIECGIFMIWPGFENEKGEIILVNDTSVPASGTARMWILVPERRSFHKANIKIGLKGNFMEGNRKVAECEVIEILGLDTNPVV